MIVYDKLYSIDSTGKVRVYYAEQMEEKYRLVSGVDGGKEVRSNWTIAEPKNVGKVNETSGYVQAKAEVEARYIKKLKAGYYSSIEMAKANPDGHYFEPMLAATWEKVIDKYKQFPLLADPKLDGMRMTAQGIERISRKGEPIMTAGHIIEDLQDFFFNHPNVRLDGELYNHEYKEDFNSLMSIARQSKPTIEDLKIAREKLQFHVYDCYHTDNILMTAIERKRWLKFNLGPYLAYYLDNEDKDIGIDSVKIVPYTLVRNQEELDIVKEQNLIFGYEGTITRAPESVYECKRSNWLLKHKDFITEEFIIDDILAGQGNRSEVAGTVKIRFGDKIPGCGIRGSFEYAKKLLDNKDEYIGKLATVRHFGVTPDGSLRFPVCIDVDRKDV